MSVCDKEGKRLTHTESVLNRWKEHFEQLLNKDEIANQTERSPPDESNSPTEAEILIAIKKLQNRKAPEPYGVNPENLKSGGMLVVRELSLI